MPLLSSQLVPLLAIGVSLYVAFSHWGMRRENAAHRWLSAWALAATAFGVARIVQVSAGDAPTALLAGRCSVALAPMFAWTLLRFVGELSDARPTRSQLIRFAAWNLGLSALTLATPLVVAESLSLRRGSLGDAYPGVVAGPLFPALVLYLLSSLSWAAWRIGKARALEPGERRTLVATLAIYGALGATSALGALGLHAIPPLAELGPLAIAIGVSQLVANRQRRLESDLTELVAQKTLALSDSEQRHRGLVENTKIGVSSCDRSGRVLTVTPRMFEIFEVPPLAQGAPANLLELPMTEANGVADAIRRVLATGKTIVVEQRRTTFRGRMLDLRGVFAPQRDASGAVTGALVLMEDVTERRALEARLRQSQKMEAIGELAGGIARGITAPLESVRENLARVREETEAVRKAASLASAEARERFGEIDELVDEASEGVSRALAIVTDMREMSNGGSPVISPVDLNELLAGVVRMAATQRREARIDERYGALPTIQGNAGQLRQVFLNLVVNALQAAGERGRVAVESARIGDRVRVLVSDDGPGIAPEHRERLFEPFFTTKPAGLGTGLGLYLSYRIVQSHGGEIRFLSDATPGARCEVLLPIEAVRAERAS